VLVCVYVCVCVCVVMNYVISEFRLKIEINAPERAKEINTKSSSNSAMATTFAPLSEPATMRLSTSVCIDARTFGERSRAWRSTLGVRAQNSAGVEARFVAELLFDEARGNRP